jgi:site-specific recombinase XerC
MTLPEAARIMREAVKDKSYRAYPLGGEAGAYLRWKRGMITASTYRDYEACLDKLARTFPDLEIQDFEPPVGTERLEEFLDRQWGDSAPRTYNKALSVVKDFFKWAVLKGKLHGDPTLLIRRHKKRDVHREIFGDDARARIIAAGPASDNLHRDRCALRLLLKYGLRKGALLNVQFKHFDHTRKRLTIFTKGGKVRELPIVEAEFWNDLDRVALETEAQPQHFLMCREVTRRHGNRKVKTYLRDLPMSVNGGHRWWYRCLERADVVAPGTTSGEKMHKARHTAGQRVLDATGNIKAAQKLLGHSSIQTTADIYTDWDVQALERTLQDMEDAERS